MEARSEVRLITCLFLDVVGSTDTTVRIGPERMQRLLTDAFGHLSATIAEHGGVVEKYVGDAILALFGVPSSHPDDAARALRCAEACVAWATESTATGGLAVRAGLETGELLVELRELETQQRMIIGTSINLAARLQSYAEPGEIVVGPTTHEAVAQDADFEAMGELDLKGLGRVAAWRFLRFLPGDATNDIELVGRERELAMLTDAMRRAHEGGATLALIVGPPGQGKSRLAAEALRAAERSRRLEARCRPGTETGVNNPLRQLIEADVPNATAPAVRDRISALLDADDAADVAARVNHAAGLEVDDRLLPLSRLEQRTLIARAWQRYLEGVARETPLTVLIEDVHWGDPVLLRVIDETTWDSSAPLFALLTARPEFVGSGHLRPRDNRLQLDLDPLDDVAAERLARVVAGDAESSRLPVQRAGGNPLFLIELARARSADTRLPVTVQAAIAARLDELSPEDRDLIQRISVVGETFHVHDAAALTEREPSEVVAALGRFVHLGFVTPVGSSYRFHHVLVRDVAYARLPLTERMALHALYAAEGVDRDDVEAVAHHWWEALKPPDADWVWEGSPRLVEMRRAAHVSHLTAGERLEQRNRYEDAAEVYLHAAELADQAVDKAVAKTAAARAFAKYGEGDAAWAQREEALRLYAQARTPPPARLYADMLEIAAFNWGYFDHLPAPDEVTRLLDEGVGAARASDDRVSLARLLAERASYTGDLSATEEIWGFLEADDAIAFADAAQRMATVFAWAGRVRESLELFATVLDRLIPAGATINVPEALAWYGMAAFYGGDLERAARLGKELGVEAREFHLHTQSHAIAVEALVLFGRGDWNGLQRVDQSQRAMATQNPDVGFCVLSAAAASFAAAARVLRGEDLGDDLDEWARRWVPDSPRVQAASVLLPKVMSGNAEALAPGLTGYEPKLGLWDRYRVWDVADLIPAIALTMLERWDDLPTVLARLDEFASGGARLAEAAAAAVREEEAAARGGAAPRHEQLTSLGYRGISELLRYRPVGTVGS